ncbi:MAG: NUDIX domain-containing protein [Solobacterium sp.]|nr:NUDIX domain-containing protein [Solobacterium sp.]
MNQDLHVCAAVITDGERVLAVERGSGPQKGGWEFPGGKMEAGESYEDTLIREIREELDLGIEVTEYLTDAVYEDPRFHLILHCCLCRITEGVPHLKEHSAMRWLKPDELDQVSWLPADRSVIAQIRAALEEERFDICDETGKPAGRTVSRTKAHAQGILHRTAHIWVIDRSRENTRILLQQRSFQKDSYPGLFDTSSAGHIQAGDEPLPSALRELEEELGIHAEETDLSYAGSFRIRYEKEFHGMMFRDNEVTFVYVYEKPVCAEQLTIQKEELECVQWFDLEETAEALAARDLRFCVPAASLKLLKEYLKKNA